MYDSKNRCLSLEQMAFFRARAHGLKLPQVLEEVLASRYQRTYHAALVIKSFLQKVSRRMRLLRQTKKYHEHHFDLVVNNPFEHWVRVSPWTSDRALFRICMETYRTDPSDWYMYSVEPEQVSFCFEPYRYAFLVAWVMAAYVTLVR